MPSLKDTKQRIHSVKNTQKITKAMKLVSSAKYARLQQRLIKSREYGQQLEASLHSLLREEALEEYPPGLFGKPAAHGPILLLVMTSERGLCGALNANLMRAATKFLHIHRQAGGQAHVVLWGKKADVLRRQNVEVLEAFSKEKALDNISFSGLSAEVSALSGLVYAGTYQAVYIAYAEFKTALSQQPVIKRWMPLLEGKEGGVAPLVAAPLCEPSERHLIECIAQKKLVFDVYECLLNGSVSEHAARMTAMDNATTNADKVIKELTLQYNRARQAFITKELIEITSGAEAI